MKPNEIHEIHWSLDQIADHIADIHRFLRSDPNYPADGASQVSAQATEENATTQGHVFTLCQGLEQRRMPQQETAEAQAQQGEVRPGQVLAHDTGQRGWGKTQAQVGAHLPRRTEASRRIGRDYARIPLGAKWVHAGCSVFVPRRVYKQL